MEINDFAKYKQDLLNEIKALYEKQDLFAVIKKLENSELDFDLCNELVRAYINAANKTSDPYSLFEKANPMPSYCGAAFIASLNVPHVVGSEGLAAFPV